MNKKYVQIEKRSKKEQKEHHAQQRKGWQGINPVTRKAPNLKVYNRKKVRHTSEDDSMSDFLYI